MRYVTVFCAGFLFALAFGKRPQPELHVQITPVEEPTIDIERALMGYGR